MGSRRKIAGRSVALFLLFAFFVGGLIGRLVYLQLYDKARYTNLAQSQRLQPVSIDAQRGNIYDRNHQLLARSIEAYSIHVIPSRERDSVTAANQLAAWLDLSADQIAELLLEQENTEKNFWLARRISHGVAKEIQALGIPGIRLITRPQRYYPQGSLAAHVLGIAGIDNQGLEGIEYQYEDLLKGVPGRLETERDAVQREIPGGFQTLIPPQNGYDLILTLDSVMQYIAEKELLSAVTASKSDAGAILVINPKTGEVLANAIYPIFDPNNYQEYPAVNRRNMIVTDQFEPGSTFKIFTAAAAMDLGIVDREREFYSGSSWSIGGGSVRSANIYGHGNITFVDAVEKSDNITFAQLSVEMGPERFYPYLSAFGFGSKTGIDFPGEVSGLLPRPGQIAHGEALQWANIGFGQGIAVTPLQLLVATSAVANNGKVMRPYYVSEIRDEYGKTIEKTEPQVLGQPILSSVANELSELLLGAVEYGSGSRARVVGIEIAGKTGTAEVPQAGGYGDERIASFVGFGPVNNPQVAILVILNNPQTEVRYGGVLAAPVFQSVAEQILEYLGVPRKQSSVQSGNMAVVPNVRNYTLTDAEAILREFNLTANYIGSGNLIRDQIPSPGSRVLPQSSINLIFYEDANLIMETVPNLIGKSMRDSSALLGELGFQFRPQGSGIAVTQFPQAGTKIPVGSIVEVEFQP